MIENQYFSKKNEIYACFEQAQTQNILPYLSIEQSEKSFCLNFNSDIATEQSEDKKSKRQRVYQFDKINNRQQKFKYCFSENINDLVKSLLQGQNRSIIIYGTEEKSKDKIVFGESQNPGILLLLLSQLFDQSHLKQLQEQLTIKLSCSLFKNGNFYNIFTKNDDMQTNIEEDLIEGVTIQNAPQIIIRNVKTGLKLMNIILKMIKENREYELTQNIIFTIKLEMDIEKKQQQTQVYCLSKLHLVKLANPSINSSLKGINKNNSWFVNLFNYLYNQSVDKKNQQSEEHSFDDFTFFLKEVIFKTSSKLSAFISITNKMTSNQCLSSLIFANYVKNLKLYPKKYYINLSTLNKQKNQFQYKLLKEASKNPDLWSSFLLIFTDFMNLLDKYMQELNFLEYEYSLILSEGCKKLNKYIFTEELQDFFYSKKVSVQVNQDLLEIYNITAETKQKINTEKQKLIKYYSQIQGFHFLKQFTESLNLLISMSSHFLYEIDSHYFQQLKLLITNSAKKQDKRKYSGVAIKQEMTKYLEQEKKPEGEVKKNQKVQKYRCSHKSSDNLDYMFKNKNVDIKTKAKKML